MASAQQTYTRVPSAPDTDSDEFPLSKVPKVTIAFWIVKIFATTLGETGGDALSMQLNLGYAVSTLIFLGFFLVTLTAQVGSKHYHPLFYWAVVVATTTVGTTTSDYLDRTVGLGYVKSSAIELALVIAILITWHVSTGQIQVDRITNRKNEIFYWVTILVSNTLGTALGDFVATTTGLGFEGGALVFAGLLAVVAALDEASGQRSLLVRLCADATSGSDGRRCPDEAPQSGRAQSQPHHVVAGDCRADDHTGGDDITPETRLAQRRSCLK